MPEDYRRAVLCADALMIHSYAASETLARIAEYRENCFDSTTYAQDVGIGALAARNHQSSRWFAWKMAGNGESTAIQEIHDARITKHRGVCPEVGIVAGL